MLFRSFFSNVVIGYITIEILRAYGRKQHKVESKLSPQNTQNQEQAV